MEELELTLLLEISPVHFVQLQVEAEVAAVYYQESLLARYLDFQTAVAYPQANQEYHLVLLKRCVTELADLHELSAQLYTG